MNGSRRLMPVTLITAIGLTLGGCTSVDTASGSSSYETLRPIEDSRPSGPSSEKDVPVTDIRTDYIPYHALGELAKPAYPSKALRSGAGRYVLYATITVGTDGRVSDVSQSLRAVTFPNRFSQDFMDATKAAVSRWRFLPARNDYWRRTSEGQMVLVKTEPTTATIDMKFTFDVK